MFLDKLKENERFMLDMMGEDYSRGARLLEWLEVGENIHLSIQASPIHYCSPREMIDLDDYTHFELALIVDNEVCYNSEKIKDFPQYNELTEYHDGMIFSYVPRELISNLYCWSLDYFKEG